MEIPELKYKTSEINKSKFRAISLQVKVLKL